MMNEITLAPAPAPLVERLLALTTDSALSENYACICARGSFIGDYFGIDATARAVYVSSVTTFNEGGANPGFHQQQLVSRLALQPVR